MSSNNFIKVMYFKNRKIWSGQHWGDGLLTIPILFQFGKKIYKFKILIYEYLEI